MNWLTHTLTFPVVLAFVVGILAGQTVNWIQYRMRLRRDPSKVVKRSSWEAVISLLAVVVLVWIMVATNQARNCSIRLAVSQANENAAGKLERDAFQTAITKSFAVPADIRDLPQNDPRYRAAMQPITDEYLAAEKHANDVRAANAVNVAASNKACGTG
jgi:predicted PurR-regulated permease PerM